MGNPLRMWIRKVSIFSPCSGSIKWTQWSGCEPPLRTTKGLWHTVGNFSCARSFLSGCGDKTMSTNERPSTWRVSWNHGLGDSLGGSVFKKGVLGRHDAGGGLWVPWDTLRPWPGEDGVGHEGIGEGHERGNTPHFVAGPGSIERWWGRNFRNTGPKKTAYKKLRILNRKKHDTLAGLFL